MKVIGTAVLCAICLAAGCKSNKAEPKARAVAPQVIRDVPSVLKGTIGAEATLLKADPILVSGYGLVVGLPGTGGGDLDERLMATMERQLGLSGIGKSADAMTGTAFEGMSPQQVLRSREVAVVVVYATVIPGAPKGATFDVYVRAASASPDISLEGGMLWSTDLQVGPATTLGRMKTRQIAVAHGPIFINPFAEPGAKDGVTRRDGRILGGGVVTNPLELELILDNESHSRARQMTAAINNRFPAEQGGDPVARGRTAQVINVTVPAAYRERSLEFLKLLTHAQLDQSMPQEYARKYVEALKAQPFLGDELSWCLQALPQKACLPFVRELYDWPEMIPRLAALRAGAGLGDPLSAPALKQLAKEASTSVRTDAIALLGRLSGPTIDQALKEHLDSDSLAVRVAAYEALASRSERVQLQRWYAQRAAMPAAALVSQPEDARPGILELSADSIQGVSRQVVEKKFILDVVATGPQVVYVTQQGRPRIVLFGENLELKRPTMVTAWSNRLMLVSDGPTDDFRILYREPSRTTDGGDVIPGRMITSRVPSNLPALIEVMARQSTPEDPRPGLGMSYSEVVGALYAFQRGGAIPGTFAVEEDLLKARLIKAANADTAPERPETPDDVQPLRVYEPAKPEAGAEAAPKKSSLVVPLEQPAPKK